MSSRHHGKTQNVEQMEKMIPLVMGEIVFRQQFCELVFGVNTRQIRFCWRKMKCLTCTSNLWKRVFHFRHHVEFLLESILVLSHPNENQNNPNMQCCAASATWFFGLGHSHLERGPSNKRNTCVTRSCPCCGCSKLFTDQTMSIPPTRAKHNHFTTIREPTFQLFVNSQRISPCDLPCHTTKRLLSVEISPTQKIRTSFLYSSIMCSFVEHIPSFRKTIFGHPCAPTRIILVFDE